MARKGRPFLGNPFQQKNAAGEYSGTFFVYNPIERKRMNLETTDRAEALAKIQSLFGHLIGKPHPKSVAPVSVVPSNEKQALEDTAGSVSPPETVSAPDGVEVRSVLDDWAKRGDGGQPPLHLVDDPTPQSSTSAAVTPITAKTKRNKNGLSAEDIEKISSGIHKTVASLNVLVLHSCVKYMGRMPYEPDEEEMHLLAVGWEMELKRHFEKAELQPWMLILAGNLFVGMAMYMNGTVIPKTPKTGPVGVP
jgi:hypothetical protein